MKVSAPPVNCRANAETERFLATRLAVLRSHVCVIRGSSSRDNTVLVHDPNEIQQSLVAHLR